MHGILNLPWWGYIVATMILTQITIVCVTVFLHRAQSHRALDLHALPSHFFPFLVVDDNRYGYQRMGCHSS